MFKKSVIAMSVLLFTAFVTGPVGLSHSKVFAHEHGRGHHRCDDCEHYICPGDCGRCEECLAKRKAAKKAAEKCEKCGHEECPGNCNKCVDCLNERIKKLERELKEKD